MLQVPWLAVCTLKAKPRQCACPKQPLASMLEALQSHFGPWMPGRSSQQPADAFSSFGGASCSDSYRQQATSIREYTLFLSCSPDRVRTAMVGISVPSLYLALTARRQPCTAPAATTMQSTGSCSPTMAYPSAWTCTPTVNPKGC